MIGRIHFRDIFILFGYLNILWNNNRGMKISSHDGNTSQRGWGAESREKRKESEDLQWEFAKRVVGGINIFAVRHAIYSLVFCV